MASGGCARMPPWLPLLLLPALLMPLLLLPLLAELPCCATSAASRYAHGSHRGGRLLTTVTPLLTKHTASRTQCASLCGRDPACRALQITTVPSGLQCQLLAETACDGHTLQDHPDGHYFDVYKEVTREAVLPFWTGAGCQEKGHCSPDCLAKAVGDPCLEDTQCSALAPPGAYVCNNDICALGGDFWEVRPGLVLPRWTNWTATPLYPSFKQLLANTCSVNLRVRLGEGGELLLAAVPLDFKLQERHMLAITADNTQHLYFADGSKSSTLMSEGVTNGLLGGDPSDWSPVTFSWCGNTLTIGNEQAPSMFSVKTPSGSAQPAFLMSTAVGALSQLQVERGAADPWLLDPAGTKADSVFNIAPGSLITRSISPSDDVTVTYDCKASGHCDVYLSDSNPLRLLGVLLGGFGNTGCALYFYTADSDKRNYHITGHHVVDTGTVLDPAVFITFRMRYRAGAVTVWRADAAEPIFEVPGPLLLGNITAVSVGSMWHVGSRKQVRLARHDPAWRTDTWIIDGTGFSNMALP